MCFIREKTPKTPALQEVSNYLRVSERRLATDAVAQAAWAEKKWVWVQHPTEGFLAGSIVSEDGDIVTIETQEGIKHKIQCFN